MRTMTALIKREYLEHRGAFVYAPIVLSAIASAAVLFAVLTGNAELEPPAYSGISAHLFRQHPPICTGVSAQL